MSTRRLPHAPALWPPPPDMRRNLLKENATALDLAQRIVDPLIVIGAGVVAYHLKFDTWELNSLYVNALLAVTLLARCFSHGSPSR